MTPCNAQNHGQNNGTTDYQLTIDAWLTSYWACRETTDRAIGWSFFGLRLSPENARILEIKKEVIEFTIANKNVENMQAIIEQLSPIIDYQRDGSITTNSTSTRKAIDAIFNPEISQKCGCGVGLRT